MLWGQWILLWHQADPEGCGWMVKLCEFWTIEIFSQSLLTTTKSLLQWCIKLSMPHICKYTRRAHESTSRDTECTKTKVLHSSHDYTNISQHEKFMITMKAFIWRLLSWSPNVKISCFTHKYYVIKTIEFAKKTSGLFCKWTMESTHKNAPFN